MTASSTAIAGLVAAADWPGPEDEVAPTCPRCCVSPLRLEPVRKAHGSRWLWRCTAPSCGYVTTHSDTVVTLLRELRRRDEVLARVAELAVPSMVRDLIAPDHLCPECERRWRAALADALARADARGSLPIDERS